MLNPFPAVVVPVPRIKLPNDALWEKRLVDDAVVEKSVVVVALVKTFLPEKVLLSPRSVEEADDPATVVIHVPFTLKQPLVRLIPPLL